MKLNGLLKTLAPTIAKTISSGNPVAGMAIKLLSDKLGIDEKNPAKIEKFLDENPERAVEVKEADRDFEDKIREMEIDLEAFNIEAQDAKDANLVIGYLGGLVSSAASSFYGRDSNVRK